MRKGKAPKRFLQPDRIYHDTTVTKFMNCLMKQGKKSIAANLLYKAFDIVEEKTKKKGHKVFQEALEKASPVVELKSRHMRRSTSKVPVQTAPERRLQIAIRSIIISSRLKKKRGMSLALANTLIQSSQGEGDVIKKKEDMHKMAQANKSLSHHKF